MILLPADRFSMRRARDLVARQRTFALRRPGQAGSKISCLLSVARTGEHSMRSMTAGRCGSSAGPSASLYRFTPAPARVCAVPAFGGLWATAGDLVRFGRVPNLVTGMDGGPVHVTLANRRMAIEPVVGQVRHAISQEHRAVPLAEQALATSSSGPPIYIVP